jgi:hypothetical protein
METRRVRLGDVIDDYCPRCRLIMNHGVVGMVGDDVRKVRCNTCLSEHVYKHNRVPARRRNATGKLFQEVLRGLGRPADSGPLPGQDPAGAAETPAGSGAGPAGEPRDEAATAAGPPAAAQPPASSPGERDDASVHGVRRKLYTIRRHTGGKPPGGGSHRS